MMHSWETARSRAFPRPGRPGAGQLRSRAAVPSPRRAALRRQGVTVPLDLVTLLLERKQALRHALIMQPHPETGTLES